jgi:hypothetical protein
MDEEKFAKWGLLGGAVFAVLIVVGGLIAGTPPKLDDPDQKIFKFFVDNKDAIRIGAYLSGVAGVVFLWFLGSLFGRLRRAEGGNGRLSGVALTGGVVAIAISSVGAAVYGYAALHSEAAVSNFRLSTLLYGYVAFPAAVFTAGVAVVLWSQKVLPKWMGYAGEALALAWLVAGGAVATENNTVATIGFIVFLAWAIWVLLLSVMLYRTPETA